MQSHPSEQDKAMRHYLGSAEKVGGVGHGDAPDTGTGRFVGNRQRFRPFYVNKFS
ncbi:MAG: hypothetical protein F6K24_09835 [Okeania sp. SIO2D1]|nr:hypothetical protein [Okeania sp. SIO2D1]